MKLARDKMRPHATEVFQNISDFTALLDSSDWNYGRVAYETYHQVLLAYANKYGFGIVPVVEAFASLSPNNDYHGNLRSLASVLHGINSGTPLDSIIVSTYNACRNRAYSYVTGQTSFLDTVKGPKIIAFRHNLLYPDTSKEVTIDGHMYAIAAGRKITMKEAALSFSRSDSGYSVVAKIIKEQAKAHKVLPHQLQASLWIGRKRIYDIKLNKQPNLFWADPWNLYVTPEEFGPYV